MILKDHIQILRVREQSNSSQIVVALGRRLGQIHVMAKGARRWPKKGFEGGFDLLVRGELLAYPRPDEQLWIFKEWDERARPALGQSYRMLAAASYLCELSEALTRMTSGSAGEFDEHAAENARLFDLLRASGEALAARAVEPGILLLNFTLNALACEGLLPDLETCQVCGARFFGRAGAPSYRKVRAWISYSGAECEACFRARRSPSPPAPLPQWGEGSTSDFARAVRGVWLDPQSLRALPHLRTTLKPLKLSPGSWAQLAGAMGILVHGGLERDLRTLSYAMTIVKRMT